MKREDWGWGSNLDESRKENLLLDDIYKIKKSLKVKIPLKIHSCFNRLLTRTPYNIPGGSIEFPETTL